MLIWFNVLLAGIPVAFVISNREDRVTLGIALKTIKKNLAEDLQVEYLMSNDTDQFYNAWDDVFGEGPKKLLCTRHMDKNWKEALHKHIPGDAALQAKVNLHFRVYHMFLLPFQLFSVVSY